MAPSLNPSNESLLVIPPPVSIAPGSACDCSQFPVFSFFLYFPSAESGFAVVSCCTFFPVSNSFVLSTVEISASVFLFTLFASTIAVSVFVLTLLAVSILSTDGFVAPSVCVFFDGFAAPSVCVLFDGFAAPSVCEFFDGFAAPSVCVFFDGFAAPSVCVFFDGFGVPSTCGVLAGFGGPSTCGVLAGFGGPSTCGVLVDPPDVDPPDDDPPDDEDPDGELSGLVFVAPVSVPPLLFPGIADPVPENVPPFFVTSLSTTKALPISLLISSLVVICPLDFTSPFTVILFASNPIAPLAVTCLSITSPTSP